MIRDLAIDHPYYCSDSNYHVSGSDHGCVEYATWEDFLSEYKDADLDLNFIFRWDVREDEESRDNFIMSVYIMQQRRGNFVPNLIKVVTDKDEASIREFLSIRWEHVKKTWEGIS